MNDTKPLSAEMATPRTESMIDSCGDYEKAWHYRGRFAEFARSLECESTRLRSERDALREALKKAEAALADIGDADREPADDLAWCEKRAAQALPIVRAALASNGEQK